MFTERFKSKQPVSRIPYASYRSIQKATFMLKMLFKQYGSIYDLSIDEFFEFYPLLAFIEYLIYETDTEIEKNQKDTSQSTQVSSWDSRRAIIQTLLKEFDLEHPTILEQMDNVDKYIKAETKLVTSEKITYEDIICACELRACDLRLLHCTLIQMSGKPYRPEVFNIMLPIEVLMEINDDFRSYQKDVASGNYNTYWIFEKLYGEEAHHYLKAEIDRYSHLFEERLKQFPQEEQGIYSAKWSRFWQRFPYLSSAELIREIVLDT